MPTSLQAPTFSGIPNLWLAVMQIRLQKPNPHRQHSINIALVPNELFLGVQSCCPSD